MEVCAYEDAIAVEEMTIAGQVVKKAVVTPANCTGCGNCVSACLNRAIQIQGWTVPQYDAMLDAFAMDLKDMLEVSE